MSTMSTRFSHTWQMPTDTNPWASPTGLPTLHATTAAIHVARVVGTYGARVVDTRESYWRRAAGGVFSPADLRIGEALLIHCGFLEHQGEYLIVKRDLQSLLDTGSAEFTAVLCAAALDGECAEMRQSAKFLAELSDLVPDSDRRDEILRGFARLFNDSHFKLVGSIGEDIVMQHARTELKSFGHPELASKVRQVSLYDDTAGYDVAAPCLDLSDRMLEVKSTTRDSDPLTVFLSRNEADTGLERANWSLVACLVDDIENRTGHVIGWLSGVLLSEHLPTDAVHGAWESAQLSIPRAWFVGGLPSPVM
jgi:uncharacterized protein DUF3883